MLDKEQLVTALPKAMRKSISQELVDNMNTVLSADPQMMDTYRENVIGFTSVLKQGKFQIKDYLNAVMYISHLLSGDTKRDAYAKTFPQRYQRMVAAGKSEKDIAAMYSMYDKGKLVNLIRDQSLIPTHIINADIFQKAINVQARIMMDEDVIARDRVAAANSLLQHLKAPETKKIELDVTTKQHSAIDDLRAATEKLVLQEQNNIRTGITNAKEVAEGKLIQGEVIENE